MGTRGGPLYPGGPKPGLGAIIPGPGPPTPCTGPWRPGEIRFRLHCFSCLKSKGDQR